MEVAKFNRRENDFVREVVSLMEGEWSYYGGGKFNRGKMVLLQRWSLRENGNVTEVACFMAGECLCYGLMEGARSC